MLKPRGKSRDLPSLDLLDENGECVAILRLNFIPGEPRFAVHRTLGMLKERMEPMRAAQAKAHEELSAAQQQQREEMADAPVNKRQALMMKWRSILSAKQLAVNQAGASMPLLTDLAKKTMAVQRSYPVATLIQPDKPYSGSANPLLAKREKQPFADQWLLDKSVLITLHQDAQGLVAGTLSHIVSNGGLKEYAIVAGKSEGTILTFTWIELGGAQGKGRFALEADEMSGVWEAGAMRTRADRLDLGLPEASWFQEVTQDFEGRWVNATRAFDNTTLRKVQPGYYEGTIAQGLRNPQVKGYAVGNVIFMMFGQGASPPMRKATLSSDGKKLAFVHPGGGVILPKNIDLTKE